jgi:formiminotetrahydrofolate cyclodeaminase
MELAEFVRRLASPEPVPGGGSASAVVAGLAAALVGMVAGLSLGRERYAPHEPLHRRAAGAATALWERALALAEEDATAYQAFAAALKLPRATEAEQAERRAAMRAAARQATRVPMETLGLCVEILRWVEALAGRSNRNAASDLGVAANLARAAAAGAAANAEINLPSVADPELEESTRREIAQQMRQVDALAAAAIAVIAAGQDRPPLTGDPAAPVTGGAETDLLASADLPAAGDPSAPVDRLSSADPLAPAEPVPPSDPLAPAEP